MEVKVGEIIRAKRQEQKISMADLAENAGISVAYLSQIENGRKQNPKLEIILNLVQALNLDMPMLLGLKDDETTYLDKIPSLLKMVFARDRNLKVLSEMDTQRKFCTQAEKLLEAKYVLEDKQLYTLFLEDVRIQTENTLKRYLAMKMILDGRATK